MAEETGTTETGAKEPPASGGSQAKKIAIALLIGLALGSLLALYTWWQMGGALQDAQEAAAEARAEFVEERAELQDRIATLEAREQLLTARVALARASLQIDARNFGLAEGHANAAGEILQQVDPEAAGVDSEAIGELRQSIGQLEIERDADRERVGAVAQQLDEMLQ